MPCRFCFIFRCQNSHFKLCTTVIQLYLTVTQLFSGVFDLSFCVLYFLCSVIKLLLCFIEFLVDLFLRVRDLIFRFGSYRFIALVLPFFLYQLLNFPPSGVFY